MSIGDTELPDRLEVERDDDRRLQLQFHSPPLNTAQKAGVGLFGAFAVMLAADWWVGDGSIVIVMVMGVAIATMVAGYFFGQIRPGTMILDSHGLTTNQYWRWRLTDRTFDWQQIQGVRAVKQQRNDMYCVEAEVDGRRRRLASQISADEAHWLSERIESVRRRLNDGYTGSPDRLESPE